MSPRAPSLNQCCVNDLLDQIKCFTLISFLSLCVFLRLSVFWFLALTGGINGQYFACKIYLNPVVAFANVLSKAIILLLIIQYLLLLQLRVWELCWFLVLRHSYFMPFLILHFNCVLAVICLYVFCVSYSQCHVVFLWRAGHIYTYSFLLCSVLKKNLRKYLNDTCCKFKQFIRNAPHNAIKWCCSAEKMAAMAKIENIFKRHLLLNPWSIFKIISQKVPHNALYQHCTTHSTILIKMTTKVKFRFF